MAISASDILALRQIIALAEQVLRKAEPARRGRPPAQAAPEVPATKRIRRTGPQLVAFRRMLKKELKEGRSVAELAARHGVSRAYIYQL